MRNLPPRMSNQPARKAWEIEVPNGEIAAKNLKHMEGQVGDEKSQMTANINANINMSMNKSMNMPMPGNMNMDSSMNMPPSKLQANYVIRNQQVYDDTGNRIAYRGGWVARGGRWGL